LPEFFQYGFGELDEMATGTARSIKRHQNSRLAATVALHARNVRRETDLRHRVKIDAHGGFKKLMNIPDRPCLCLALLRFSLYITREFRSESDFIPSAGLGGRQDGPILEG